MNDSKHYFKKIATVSAALGLLLFALSTSALAKEVSYDRYAPVYTKPPAAPSTFRKVSTGFLTYPLEPLRALANETLLTVEKYHLKDKAMWVYDTLGDNGITPKTGTVAPLQGIMGADVDFIKMARLKTEMPDVVLHGHVFNVRDLLFKTGGHIGLERIGGSGLYVHTHLSYEYRPQDYYYGIGPHTSRGDGGVYSYEETAVGPEIGYQLSDDLKAQYSIKYRNINIGEGHRSGRLQARDFGPAGSLIGGCGDKLLSQEFALAHDSRNHQQHSDRGGLSRISLGYHEGLEDSRARYLRYQAQLSRYLSLWSPRRVLVARAFAEHNSELGSGEMPFHQMAKLGGYGDTYYQSQTLRAFGPNRFFDHSSVLFNLEYRYNIWQYRDFRTDAVAFFETGQVFSRPGQFQFDDFRESYGGGMRFSVAYVPVMSIEAAHGDEGTNFYVKSEMPF